MPDIDFETTVRVRYMRDHVPGNFTWDRAPSCCANLIRAFEEKATFVSNMVDTATDGDMYPSVYMLPLTADGTLLHDKGVPIRYCPFCGTEIRVQKA